MWVGIKGSALKGWDFVLRGKAFRAVGGLGCWDVDIIGDFIVIWGWFMSPINCYSKIKDLGLNFGFDRQLVRVITSEYSIFWLLL